MSLKTRKIIHTAFSIVTSLILVAVGALFITQCIGIYNSGDRPFTRESIGAAFKEIMIPMLVFVIVTVAGAIISVVLPITEKKKPQKNLHYTQIRLTKLCDEKRLTKAELFDIRREKTLRYIIGGGGIILFTVSLIYPALYIFSPDRFGSAGPEAINSEFIRAFCVLILCLVPFALYLIFGTFALRASYQREIEVLKGGSARISKENRATVNSNDIKPLISDENTVICTKNSIPVSKKLIFILQIAILCTAVVLIVLGINNGGVADVLEKAKKVCSECIGLG